MIVSAEFLDDSVQVNTPVELEVVTGSAAKKIVIQNENNGKMGATLVARTINSDGTITWTYSMSIGTAGDARQFSVLAQDAAGEYSNPYVAIIRVVA